MHVIGHIKITRTRRRVALFDERIYMHVIGHIKITHSFDTFPSLVREMFQTRKKNHMHAQPL